MKKIALTFGGISGLIIIITMIIGLQADVDGKINFDDSMVLGYVTMIIALSAIFFGIKSYRDKHLEGIITFGKGFKLGFNISLVSSIIYVLVWMIYIQTDAGSNFDDQYLSYEIEKLQESGETQEKIDEEIAILKDQMETYKNPFFKIIMTFLEIFPIGLLVSLISAAILKKSAEATTE